MNNRPGGRDDRPNVANNNRPNSNRPNNRQGISPRETFASTAFGPSRGPSGQRDGDRNRGDWDRDGNRGGDRRDGNRGDWNRNDRDGNDRNRGDWNRNDWNRGDGNRGDWSRNDWNRNNWDGQNGNRNDWNRGDWNRGDWNRGDWNRQARNFNNRFSGGWNRWQNNSFFFGVSTPFGGFSRGYYPWYNRGFWPSFAFNYFNFYPYYSYGYAPAAYYGYPAFGYSTYLDYGSYYDAYPAYATYSTYSNPSYTTYSNTVPSYPSYTTYAAVTTQPTYAVAQPQVAALPVDPAPVQPGPSVSNDTTAAIQAPSLAPPDVNDLTAADFAGQGEIDFRAGQYDAAVRNFRHALVDDPTNAGVLMLLGQALFARGDFDESAGATAFAMQALPQDKWGAVLVNYTQLYGNPAEYVTQLRALEAARDKSPEHPALRFLLGFHYAYRGTAAQAIAELDKVITLAPQDEMSKRLRDMIKARQ